MFPEDFIYFIPLPIGLIGSLVGIFVIAVLYEGLKVLRDKIQQNKLKIFNKLKYSVKYIKLNTTTDTNSLTSSYGSIETVPQ